MIIYVYFIKDNVFIIKIKKIIKKFLNIEILYYLMSKVKPQEIEEILERKKLN